MPYFPPGIAETDQSRAITEVLDQQPRRGKVRDIWDLGEYLLMVTSDRVSAFDMLLGRLIRNKGVVLNLVALYWFLSEIDPFNHLVACGSQIDDLLPKELRKDPDLQLRSMIVTKTEPVLVECVARGYLTGSGWRDYVATGKICGIQLPNGLREGDKLSEPIFTPSTKAEDGHDQNISEAEAAKLVRGGMDTIQMLRIRTLETYAEGAARAANSGIIMADTKFEYGWLGENLLLIDEALTPDSSRYWPREAWERMQKAGGGTPPSFDKEYLRTYLRQRGFMQLTPQQAGEFPLPDNVHDHLSHIYEKLLQQLTGQTIEQFAEKRLGIKKGLVH